ncbi:hypothetical protein [Jeotgalibacillus campisalis]|uniref:Uncharacterized protein n=1 Tax=Jeotgalibacillus campisalis TaxID=220754 RepID=A0A0C2VPP4_9BACL|nr:hypothetical protein [Jeotgalibacillus campisalis]KIL46411.1 hypothetical protein KR50_30860 [Jeotgalibacillus campisalis]
MYSTETLPIWFWLIYYLFIAATAASAIFSIVHKRNRVMAFLILFLSFLIPVAGLVNGIARPEGQNEYDHWFSAFQEGEAWALFVVAGHALQLVWWMWFIFKFKPWHTMRAAGK